MQNGLPVSLQLPIDQFLSAFLEEQIVALPLQTGKTLEVRSYLFRFPFSAIEQLVPLSAVQMKIGLQES